MGFLIVLCSVIVALSSWPIFNLLRNYNEARKIGLPIIITPVSIMGPIWALTEHRLAPFLESIPFGICKFVDYSGFGWFWKQRCTLHDKYGPAFIIVTPGELEIVVADAAAADEILSRRKDFIKAEAMYKPLEIFGPNVDTVNGEDWQRHRRITTPPFNERNSSHVWKESLRQATGMLQNWTAVVKSGVASTSKDTLTLALHVLTSAGLGKSYPFDGGLSQLSGGHTMSYRDALHKVLSNLFTTIIITSIGLPAAILPRELVKVTTAVTEFREYMVEMVKEEKASIQQEAEKDNLLSVLVRISAQEDGSKGRNGLSDDEIMGNLFIYNLAGHDTTANTLAYAVTLMASDFYWQAWIREELQSVFGTQESEDWDYEEAFPRMTRCLALMYETLRLYGPIIVIPKNTGGSSTTLKIQGREYILPPQAFVPINVAALHTLPEYWGEDALVWRPDRWIETISGTEQLYQPPPGVFLPWASGPRVCPGKKFAQVEFVAVIAKLFRQHQVKPLLEPGEGAVEAKARLMEMVQDSGLVITLQMEHPEKVKLVWEDVLSNPQEVTRPI